MTVVMLITNIAMALTVADLKAVGDEFLTDFPSATAEQYTSFMSSYSNAMIDLTDATSLQSYESSSITDTSVNTGVGSFNGDYSNSFNNVQGDSEITIDTNEVTEHKGGFNDTTTQVIEQTVKTNTAVSLTNLTTSGMDTCLGSATGGISIPGFGVSGGATMTDENCVRLKNAKLLISLGLTDAAVALISIDPDVAMAIKIAYPELYKKLVIGGMIDFDFDIEEEVVSVKSEKKIEKADTECANDLLKFLCKKIKNL